MKPTERLLDSGAFATMTPIRSIILNFTPVNDSFSVSVANGHELPVLGFGQVDIGLPGGLNIRLKVLYVPSLTMNLLSINDIIAQGYQVVFDAPDMQLIDKKSMKSVSRVPRGSDNSYSIKCTTSALQCHAVRRTTLSFEELHQTLGHTRAFTLRNMIRKGHFGDLNITEIDKQFDCIHCRMCKSVNPPHETEATRKAKFAGDIISADVIDIRSYPSIEGHKFVSVLVDHYTYITNARPLLQKDALSIKQHVEDFEKLLANVTNRPIRTLRSDQGSEYDNAIMRMYTTANGTTHEFANVRVPADNGFAERRIRTLVEHARAMITAAGLPTSYWSHAISYACFIQNRIPRMGHQFKSPFERLFGIKPAYSKLAIFGQICFLRVEDPDKFNPTSIPSLILGYSSHIDGHIIQRLDNNAIITSRNVNFPALMFINNFPATQGGSRLESTEEASSTLSPISEPDVLHEVSPLITSADEIFAPEPVSTSTSTVNDTIPVPNSRQVMKQKATEAIAKLFRPSGTACSAQIGLGKTLKGDLAPLYEAAREKEWNSLLSLDAFEIVNRPADQKPIRSHFVHSIKTHADGSFDCVKGRLVANGNEQEQGISFTETYAPTPAPDVIRLLLIIAAHKEWAVGQADVKTAYVHAPLSERIYAEIPRGINVINRKNKVLLLKKALYGLKQAGHQWNIHMKTCLAKSGWKVSEFEPCLYKRGHGEYLLIYVDDMMVVAPTQDSVATIIQDLNSHFPVKDLGPLHDFLGMEIQRDWQTKSFRLRQLGLLNETLEYARPLKGIRNIPMNPHADIFAKTEPLDAAEHSQYRTLVGKLLYAARLTRPDLSNSINLLGRFLECPTKQQWIALCHVIEFIRSTKDMYLELRSDGDSVHAYSDADWAGDKNDRKSTSGHIVFYRGAPTNWATKKQKCVASSTLESEYISMADAARDAFYTKRLAEHLEAIQVNATLHCDNIAAQTVAEGKSGNITKGAKHIEIKYHLVRDLISKGDITIKRVDSKLNCADMFTKPLQVQLFQNHSKTIGLTD